MTVFYPDKTQRAFFCLLLLGFLGVVAGIYVHCRRMNIWFRQQRRADNRAVLDEAYAVQEDAKERSRVEERKGRIAEALLTKLIVNERGDNDDDPKVQAEDPNPNTKGAMDVEQCQPEFAKKRQCNDVEEGHKTILLSDVQGAHGEECNICLSSFQVGDAAAWSNRGGCQHAFHEKCISRWLLAGDECPICRRSFGLKPEEMDDVKQH